MIKAGVTGGIGSGKSTLCRVWEELGAEVVYADDLAKEIMVKDPEVIEAIKKEFGPDSYTDSGELNRPYLSKKAFEEGKVDVLNRIVHPAVYRETGKLAEKAAKEGCELFVKEAALLLQNGRPSFFDVIVIVRGKEENRIKRVMRRDDVPEQMVTDRMQKQQDFSRLEHLADYVIYNDGTLDEFKKKTEELYYIILSQS